MPARNAQETTSYLVGLIGRKPVAYICKLASTAQVRRWESDEATPTAEQFTQLTRAADILRRVKDIPWHSAWLHGTNTFVYDEGRWQEISPLGRFATDSMQKHWNPPIGSVAMPQPAYDYKVSRYHFLITRNGSGFRFL